MCVCLFLSMGLCGMAGRGGGGGGCACASVHCSSAYCAGWFMRQMDE